MSKTSLWFYIAGDAQMVILLSERPLRTRFGVWRELLYSDGRTQSLVLVYGDIRGVAKVPCRVHSDCLSGHVFNSVECDCREQMEMAQRYIFEYGNGLAIWLDQDGRGNGHLAQMEATKKSRAEQISQSAAYEALGYMADHRNYASAAYIIRQLQVTSVILLSNNPDKLNGLKKHGVAVQGTVSLALNTEERPDLDQYYQDKKAMGHTL